MAHSSADAAMQSASAAAAPEAPSTAAAGGWTAAAAQIRVEIEQLRVSTGIMVDARGDQIKADIAQAATNLFDDLKVDAARAAVEVDRIRQDCGVLQAEILGHQQNLESQVGLWQHRLQSLLVEFEEHLGVKIQGIDSDLLHQDRKLEGITAQVKGSLDQLSSRINALEATVQGKGAGGGALHQGEVLRGLADRVDEMGVHMATVLSRLDRADGVSAQRGADPHSPG